MTYVSSALQGAYDMFYRYEVLEKDGTWSGICASPKGLNPDEKRYLNRYIREPKWYRTGNNTEKASTCWLTEEGFRKYKGLLESLIQRHNEWVKMPPVRLRTAESLENIVVKGKIQVISLNN